jgi:uncharacterized caspase-like protein
MTRRTAGFFPILAIATTLMSGTALAENRIALVIGNSSYRTAAALPNPTKDATAVAGVLTNAGFEVSVVSDLSQGDMRRAVRDFSNKVAEKGPDTVALVFYAGHGLQVDGENFLVPIDARIERESDVAIETVRLADVMNALAAAPSKIRIVMLDACRNNPFESIAKSGGKGLAIVDAPSGTIVAYSTAPGAEAADGVGSNSPYTAAFLKVVKQPELQIEQLFKRVRLLVNDATDGKQIPWESSSLTSDFWFFPVKASVTKKIDLPPATADQPGVEKPAGTEQAEPTVEDIAKVRNLQLQARKGEIRRRPVSSAYELVIEEDDVLLYEEFIEAYPDDPLAERIRVLLTRRKDATAWRSATVRNTRESYSEYLAAFGGGGYALAAARLVQRPRLRPIDPVFTTRIAPRVVSRPPITPVVRPIVTTPPKILPKGTTTLPKTTTVPRIQTKTTSLPKVTKTTTKAITTKRVFTPKATVVRSKSVQSVVRRQSSTPRISSTRTLSAPRASFSPRSGGGGGGGGRRR